MDQPNPSSHKQTDEPPPPIFQSWRQMYAFVLIMHAIIIGLFYWFTVSYS
jgi:hypothetical protein